MQVKSAAFVASAAQLNQCPPGKIPEFAFIGRSNVGKSSLINMLTGIKGLAKTSSTPGKTQLLNYFIINNQWHLVDLPGYGFAKVSREQREKWEKRLYEYLSKRENLYCVFVLVDARLEPQKNDVEMINWLGKNGVPMAIVYTKTDKVKPLQLETNITAMHNTLLRFWEQLPPIMLTSSEDKSGKEELLSFIAEACTK
jgi:GTP-binding protein